MADFPSFDSIDDMINEASSGVDFSNYFTGGGEPFNFDQLDTNALSFDDIDSLVNNIDFDNLAATFESDQMPGNINLGGFAETPLDQVDWQSLYNEGLTPEQQSARESLMSDLSQYNQDFGGADVTQYMDEYQSNLKDIAGKGGFTSQWQNVDGRKVQVYDDGTGMAINPSTGASRSLSSAEVDKLIAAGKLNTYESGYNTATGGTRTAPGGGVPVTLKDGSKGTLMPDGRVIDSNTGTVIGNSKDVATTTRPTTTGTTTAKPQQKSDLGSLLPLLLMMLAMNQGRGGGGTSNTVIPALTAAQRQTPYTQQQRAPGYRPGQGGITYFEPTQYTPRMAGGGIAELDRGRLLDGPGDGVSDSIPAMIGGMAGGGQPARLARGEYVIDARTVAALGNGSTDAGAERLDEMRRKILADDRKAGVGKDSKAYRHLKA